MTQHIYNELMNLVSLDDTFYFKDHVLGNETYRVFSYRLASWSQFMAPSALSCRGIMFRVTDGKQELASFPMDKFFNVGEGGIDTEGHTVACYMEKLDGSLISTFIHEGQLRLKSKTSLNSEQAIAAMRWIDRKENSEFKAYATNLALSGKTVNMEYTSPMNRIVCPYQEEKLTILSVRDHRTGVNQIHFDNPFHVKVQTTNLDYYSFEKSVEDMRDIEGYVIQVRKPSSELYLVKKKTEWYCALHRTKDSISSDRRLFECVINESSDDLRSIFAGDNFTLNRVKDMEEKVIPKFNQIVRDTETFYAENKHLVKKDYAIKGQQEVKEIFPLVMELYVGREPDFKAFAVKHQKDIFGVSDKVYENGDS